MNTDAYYRYLQQLEQAVKKLEETTAERAARLDAERVVNEAQLAAAEHERQVRIADAEKLANDPFRQVVEHAMWVSYGMHPAEERIQETLNPTPPPPPAPPKPAGPLDRVFRQMKGEINE